MTQYNKNEPETIQYMFGSIAKRYDRANAILSLQLHKYWNAELVKQVTKGQNPKTFIDLCSGTGDIALAFLKSAPPSQQVIMIDFCQEMLDCAKDKADKMNLSSHHLDFIQADVQELPLADRSASCATMAYGIRNVKEPLKCFQEVYRVLQPGGAFGILELTQPKHPIIKMGHSLYLRYFLPILGKLITSNQEAYRYLCNSIKSFTPPAELERMLILSGFVDTKQIPLAFGTATILIGSKPKS